MAARPLERTRLAFEMIESATAAFERIGHLGLETMPAWELERQTQRIWSEHRRRALRLADRRNHLQSAAASSMHAAYHRRKK